MMGVSGVRVSLRRIASLGLVGLFVVVACQGPTGGGPQSGTPKPGGTLTVALDGEIDTIDPHKSVTIVGFQVYTQVYEGLVRASKKLDRMEPLLAESWEQPDELTYVFKLRSGVKFHNGKEFTAEDVRYTFERVMDKDFASPRRPDFTPVDRVEVVDDRTVRFVMSKPFAPFLSKLEALRIVPKSEGIDFAKQPVGTGPFTFVEWVSGQKIALARNPDYWQKGRPYVDEVIFRPVPEASTRVVELQTGNVDLLNAVPLKDVAELEKDAKVQVYRVSGVVRDHLGFNMNSPLFKDNPNLRKAIAWAIDRETIVRDIVFGLGTVAQVPIPESHPYFNRSLRNTYGFDLQKAKEFYDKADPKPTQLTVKVSPTYPDQPKMAELIQPSLAKIGIELKIVQLEWSTWIKEVVSQNEYELEIVLISGGIDADDFFYQWLHTGEGFNIWKYSDPQMDKLLEDGRATTDEAKRKDLYARIQQKVVDDAPMTHILYRESVMAASARLKDFVMTGRYDMDFRDVWLDR